MMRACSVHTCWAGRGSGGDDPPTWFSSSGTRTRPDNAGSDVFRATQIPTPSPYQHNVHFGITSSPTLFSTGHSYSPAAFLWNVSLRRGRTRMDEDGRMGTSSEPHELSLGRTLARHVCVCGH